MKQKKSSFLY